MAKARGAKVNVGALGHVKVAAHVAVHAVEGEKVVREGVHVVDTVVDAARDVGRLLEEKRVAHA